MLFESIFQLDRNAFIDSKKIVIEPEMNSNETDLLRKLNKGLSTLYMLNLYDIDGRNGWFNVQMSGVVKFKLAEILKYP